jgi:predicted nucleic acid-binding protein
MKKYFLDSSVIIEYLRGNREVIEKIDSLEGHLVSSYLCLAELFEGAYFAKNQEKAKKIITVFFQGLDQIFGIDKEIADVFGGLRNNLRKQGKMIEDIDIFIAATCIVNNLTLFTLNKKHFQRIKELLVL